MTDKVLGVNNGAGLAAYYQANVSTATDYYPFGSAMPGRSLNPGDYRFGFNGKENDGNGEWGARLVQDYGFRLYNPSIGRFLSVDPLSEKYPMYSPYQFSGNTPIFAIDIDGLEGGVLGAIFGAAADIAGQVVSNYLDGKPLFKIDVISAIGSAVQGFIDPKAGICKWEKVVRRTGQALIEVTKELLKKDDENHNRTPGQRIRDGLVAFATGGLLGKVSGATVEKIAGTSAIDAAVNNLAKAEKKLPKALNIAKTGKPRVSQKIRAADALEDVFEARANLKSTIENTVTVLPATAVGIELAEDAAKEKSHDVYYTEEAVGYKGHYPDGRTREFCHPIFQDNRPLFQTSTIPQKLTYDPSTIKE